MTKYSKEEFCEVDGYRCLMTIEYELISEEGHKRTYKKVKCNCHNVKEGKCDKGTSCTHFTTANDIIVE